MDLLPNRGSLVKKRNYSLSVYFCHFLEHAYSIPILITIDFCVPQKPNVLLYYTNDEIQSNIISYSRHRANTDKCILA